MERLYNYNSKRPTYNDLTFRLLISVPAAAYMVLYRQIDSLWESFFDPSFWIGGIYSYLICILLLWIIRKVTMRLDSFCDWRRQTLFRALYQFCLGIAATVVLTFLLATLFFFFFNTDIRDTDYVSDDLPLVVLLIILANLYYLAFYLWQVPPDGFVPLNKVEEVLLKQEPKETNKLLFLAETDEGIIPLVQENIAAVFRQNEYVLIKTFDRKTMTVNQAINQIYKALDSFHFFQINPRWIVNYKICLKFRTGNYGKRYLDLSAPLDSTAEVTRGRVKDFETWMRR